METISIPASRIVCIHTSIDTKYEIYGDKDFVEVIRFISHLMAEIACMIVYLRRIHLGVCFVKDLTSFRSIVRFSCRALCVIKDQISSAALKASDLHEALTGSSVGFKKRLHCLPKNSDMWPYDPHSARFKLSTPLQSNCTWFYNSISCFSLRLNSGFILHLDDRFTHVSICFINQVFFTLWRSHRCYHSFAVIPFLFNKLQ